MSEHIQLPTITTEIIGGPYPEARRTSRDEYDCAMEKLRMHAESRGQKFVALPYPCEIEPI